jgi:hypothetical protein
MSWFRYILPCAALLALSLSACPPAQAQNTATSLGTNTGVNTNMTNGAWQFIGTSDYTLAIAPNGDRTYTFVQPVGDTLKTWLDLTAVTQGPNVYIDAPVYYKLRLDKYTTGDPPGVRR